MGQPQIRRVYASSWNPFAYSRVKPKKQKVTLLFHASYNEKYATVADVVRAIRNPDAHNPLFISNWFHFGVGPKIPHSAQMLLATAYIKENRRDAFKNGQFDINKFKEFLLQEKQQDIVHELKDSYFKNIKLNKDGTIDLDVLGREYAFKDEFLSLENRIQKAETDLSKLSSIKDTPLFELKETCQNFHNNMKKLDFISELAEPEKKDAIDQSIQRLKTRFEELVLNTKFIQHVMKCNEFVKEVSDTSDNSPYLLYLKIEKLRKKNLGKSDSELKNLADKTVWTQEELLEFKRESGADCLVSFVILMMSEEQTIYNAQAFRLKYKESFEYLKNNFRNAQQKFDDNMLMDALEAFMPNLMTGELAYTLVTISVAITFLEEQKAKTKSEVPALVKRASRHLSRHLSSHFPQEYSALSLDSKLKSLIDLSRGDSFDGSPTDSP